MVNSRLYDDRFVFIFDLLSSLDLRVRDQLSRRVYIPLSHTSHVVTIFELCIFLGDGCLLG